MRKVIKKSNYLVFLCVLSLLYGCPAHKGAAGGSSPAATSAADRAAASILGETFPGAEGSKGASGPTGDSVPTGEEPVGSSASNLDLSLFGSEDSKTPPKTTKTPSGPVSDLLDELDFYSKKYDKYENFSGRGFYDNFPVEFKCLACYPNGDEYYKNLSKHAGARILSQNEKFNQCEIFKDKKQVFDYQDILRTAKMELLYAQVLKKRALKELSIGKTSFGAEDPLEASRYYFCVNPDYIADHKPLYDSFKALNASQSSEIRSREAANLLKSAEAKFTSLLEHLKLLKANKSTCDRTAKGKYHHYVDRWIAAAEGLKAYCNNTK